MPKTKRFNWFYSKKVKELFFHPRNTCKTEKEFNEFKKRANARGISGSPVCGDQMEFILVIDPKTERIKECRWRSFGCASALASTSMLSIMITEKKGMKINRALKIKPQDIVKRLNGLPNIKYHCSVLGYQALRAAIKNYQEKHSKKS